jgi:AAA+ ATPase superfamily predicted ATPase
LPGSDVIEFNSTIDLFPLSIAADAAFCNRIEELSKLTMYIEHHRPVLLASPRRYGKTSLALRAIEATRLPYAHIDLFSAVDEQDIERAVLKGVGSLISKIESLPKKALKLASEFFEGTHLRVALTKIGIEVEFSRDNDKKPAHRILEVLQKLEKLSVKVNKKMVLFFDEFQCIKEVTTDHALEGVFRQIAQQTKVISFIFSGSNRHLLNELFEDRNRPFYKLCERITLDRISEEKYIPHLQSAAMKKWKVRFLSEELDAIFNKSHRHPYYLNLLCSRIFLKKDKPHAEAIQAVWLQYVLEERSNVASEMDLLSKNQKKLLIMLARERGTNAPLGQEFIRISNISKTTVEQSLKFLQKRDYVYQDDTGCYKILDPLIATVLESN